MAVRRDGRGLLCSLRDARGVPRTRAGHRVRSGFERDELASRDAGCVPAGGERACRRPDSFAHGAPAIGAREGRSVDLSRHQSLRPSGHELRELPRSGHCVFREQRLEQRRRTRLAARALRAPERPVRPVPEVRPALPLRTGGRRRRRGVALRRVDLERARRHGRAVRAPSAVRCGRDEQPQRGGDRTKAARCDPTRPTSLESSPARSKPRRPP